MITPADIKTFRHKDLAQLAKRRGITGWHSMKKAELVAAILKSQVRSGSAKPAKVLSGQPIQAIKAAQTVVSRTSEPRAALERQGMKPRAKKPLTETQRRIRMAQANREQLRDLSALHGDIVEDQILLMVRDPYWLQANWEISARSIERG